MILSDKYQFVFIHIPKCAGTSVRRAILPYHDADGRFLKAVDTHPDFGELDFRHLPLDLLRDIDPDAFQKLKTYDSYALVRDPNLRFRSAMAQRAKMYLGQEIAQMSVDALKNETDRVIAYLSAEPRVISPEYVHFLRQSAFVQLDGERYVNHIYPLEYINAFFADIGAKIGVDALKIEHANKTQVLRYPLLKHMVYSASRLAKFSMPATVHNRLRKRARRALMTSGKGDETSAFNAPHVEAFVTKYYADDIKLYHDALSRYKQHHLAGSVLDMQ